VIPYLLHGKEKRRGAIRHLGDNHSPAKGRDNGVDLPGMGSYVFENDGWGFGSTFLCYMASKDLASETQTQHHTQTKERSKRR